MKIKNKLMRRAFSAVVFAVILAALGIVGCEKATDYKINAPADLQDRIDSIAAANDRGDTGDTTYFNLSNLNIGADDYSNDFWTSFSDYFSIPTNQLLHVELSNYNSGASGQNRWNNWALVIANKEGNTSDASRDDLDYVEGYLEYFVLRADAAGWGDQMKSVDDSYGFDANLLTHDYPGAPDGDTWDEVNAILNGSSCVIEIDHSATGNVYITATSTGADGTVITETYQQPVSASDDIVAFFTCEKSYVEMHEAYLIPSKITEIIDYAPTSISVSGVPTSVEQADDLTIGDFWGNGVATVSFSDGSAVEVDTADVSFNVIPDLTTLGEKTVIVSYAKTKEGSYAKAVSTVYTVAVTNPVSSLRIETAPEVTTYAFFGTEAPAFDPTGLVVEATYSDGTTGYLDNSVLKYSIPLEAGIDKVATITYESETGDVSTTTPITVVQGTSQVGATDLSSAFFAAISSDYTVAPNTSETITFYTYSAEGENYHCPITVLRNSDHATTNIEYAVTRWDNNGWGQGYIQDDVVIPTLTSDWNWDIFKSNISGSKTILTVTNNGDDTADVLYEVTYANGETHFQSYAGIVVTSSDLTFAITVEKCYHVIVD